MCTGCSEPRRGKVGEECHNSRREKNGYGVFWRPALREPRELRAELPSRGPQAPGAAAAPGRSCKCLVGAPGAAEPREPEAEPREPKRSAACAAEWELREPPSRGSPRPSRGSRREARPALPSPSAFPKARSKSKLPASKALSQRSETAGKLGVEPSSAQALISDSTT